MSLVLFGHIDTHPAHACCPTSPPRADVRASLSLVELRLRGCGLTDACAPALAAMLAEAPALQLLDLSANSLTAAGAVALAAGVRGLEYGMDYTGGEAAGQTPSVQFATLKRAAPPPPPPRVSPLHTLLLCDNPLG